MNSATGKAEHLWIILGFLGLLLYLLLVRPAPEQSLRSAIPVDADPNRVAALVRNGRPGFLRSVSLMTEVARWVAGEGFTPMSLLTREQKMRVWVEPQGGATVLSAEMRWQARGGLLGKALDALLSRSAREAALAESLMRLKAAAESAPNGAPRPASNRMAPLRRAPATACAMLN